MVAFCLGKTEAALSECQKASAGPVDNHGLDGKVSRLQLYGSLEQAERPLKRVFLNYLPARKRDFLAGFFFMMMERNKTKDD